MVILNSYAENETFFTVFLNSNNRDTLAYYHWNLNLEIIEHSEIIIYYYGIKFLTIICHGNYS